MQQQATPPFSCTEAGKHAAQTLETFSIFRYESAIEDCNNALIHQLLRHATSGGKVNLADFVARYAYDVMAAATTNKQFGFLAHPTKFRTVPPALKQHKIFVLLDRDMLLYNPPALGIAKVLGFGKGYVKAIAKEMKTILETCDKITNKKQQASTETGGGTKVQPLLQTDARLAIILAGSEPVYTHILACLHYIYSNRDILQRLRDEIAASRIHQPPKLKWLIHRKPKMRMLHGVMEKTMRFHIPHATGAGYVSPSGGVVIHGHHVPAGVSHPSSSAPDRSIRGPRQCEIARCYCSRDSPY